MVRMAGMIHLENGPRLTWGRNFPQRGAKTWDAHINTSYEGDGCLGDIHVYQGNIESEQWSVPVLLQVNTWMGIGARQYVQWGGTTCNGVYHTCI